MSTNTDHIIFINRSFHYVNGFILGVIANKKEVKEGFASVFKISPERKNWSYKMKLDSQNPAVFNEDYYSSDLISLLRHNNITAAQGKLLERGVYSPSEPEILRFGFYKTSPVSEMNVTLEDLMNRPLLMKFYDGENVALKVVCVKNSSRKLFNKLDIEVLTGHTKERLTLNKKTAEELLFDKKQDLQTMTLLLGADGTEEGWIKDQIKKQREAIDNM